jgi:hypothetical protein
VPYRPLCPFDLYMFTLTLVMTMRPDPTFHASPKLSIHGVPGPATYEMQKLPWAGLAPPREIDGQMLYDSFFIPGKSTNQMGSAVSLASKKLATDQ